MNLYEVIFKRRSVREYDFSPLEQDVLDKIQNEIKNAVQLDGQNARFEIVDGSKTTYKNAPYAITACCEKNICQYINVGYTLQKIDLYLQSIGLGSIWIGMCRPKEDLESFCIFLAFGKTKLAYREGEKDFGRLDINCISNADNTIARAARLSPSAMNSQPWYLEFLDDRVRIKYQGRGLMQKILKRKMSKIDIGIITAITEQALLFEGKNIQSIKPVEDGKGFYTEIIYS